MLEGKNASFSFYCYCQIAHNRPCGIFSIKPLITLALTSWTLICNPTKMPFRKLLGLTPGLIPLTLPLSRVNYLIDLLPILPASAMKPVNRMTNSIRLLYRMSLKHCHSNRLLLTSRQRCLPRTARPLLRRNHTNIGITTRKYTINVQPFWVACGKDFAAGRVTLWERTSVHKHL